MRTIGLMERDHQLPDLGHEKGAVLFPLGHDQAHEVLVIGDGFFEIRRLERGVSDPSCLDHGLLRLVTGAPAGIASCGQARSLVVERLDGSLPLPRFPLAVLAQKPPPMLNSAPRSRPAAAGAILTQGVKHDLANRLAGLARQHAYQLGSLGVADMDLVFHDAVLRVGIKYICTSSAATPATRISGTITFPAIRQSADST